MTCSNCHHPFIDHVVHVVDDGASVSFYYPVHRNYDCPCTKYENDDLRETPHP